jgi:hypothetical protein
MSTSVYPIFLLTLSGELLPQQVLGPPQQDRSPLAIPLYFFLTTLLKSFAIL